jgi:hypothetical protein
MITDAELLALSVFVGMGCYISYLRHRLRTSEHKRYFLEMVIVDVLEGSVEIRKVDNGFTIHKTEQTVN